VLSSSDASESSISIIVGWSVCCSSSGIAVVVWSDVIFSEIISIVVKRSSKVSGRRVLSSSDAPESSISPSAVLVSGKETPERVSSSGRWVAVSVIMTSSSK